MDNGFRGFSSWLLELVSWVCGEAVHHHRNTWQRKPYGSQETKHGDKKVQSPKGYALNDQNDTSHRTLLIMFLDIQMIVIHAVQNRKSTIRRERNLQVSGIGKQFYNTAWRLCEDFKRGDL